MLYRTHQPKEEVMKPDKDGMVTDHYTGEKIRYSEAEKGHLMYYEHRYMKEAAEKMNMSQKQFNKMNKCSDVLVPQKKANNRGRGFECQDDSVGFNTSLNHIAQYLKYGKSKTEQANIDKQVQKARIAYYKEHRAREKADCSRSKKPVSTQRESLLTPENKLNYKKLDAYIEKDKARAAKLANRKAKGSMKKSSSKTKNSASVRYSVSRSKSNGHTVKGGRIGKGGAQTGGKGIGSGHAGAHGGIGGARGSVGSGGAHTGGGHTGGGGKGGGGGHTGGGKGGH